MAKTEHDILSDADLEAVFAEARAEAPVPSEALLARIMAGAEAEILAHEAAAAAPLGARRPGLLAGVIAVLGGWPALAGMVTATLAGVWIGFAQPDSVNTLTGGLLLPDSAATTSYELEDMLPGYGDLTGLLEEG